MLIARLSLIRKLMKELMLRDNHLSVELTISQRLTLIRVRVLMMSNPLYCQKLLMDSRQQLEIHKGRDTLMMPPTACLKSLLIWLRKTLALDKCHLLKVMKDHSRRARKNRTSIRLWKS